MTYRPTLRLLPWLLVPGSLTLLAGCGDNVVGAQGACGASLLPGDLVITEFLANPAGADNEDSFEWFEIYNGTDQELELRGLLLSRTEQDTTNAKLHEVGRSWLVPPQSYTVAGALLDDELDVVPHIDYGYAADLGNMKNGDGRLVISCGSDVIDEVVYQDEQIDGRSRGFSGQLGPDALLNDDLSQWCDARTPFDSDNQGTPGEPNDVCLGDGPISCFDTSAGDYRDAVAPAVGSLVITEIMSDPSAVDDDAGEWFEVYVEADFDLNGLALGKDPGLDDAEPLSLNDCMTVTAGTRLVFAHSDDESENGGLPQVDALFDFSLNQDNNQIVISYQGMIIDELPYGSTDAGVAWNLDPDFRSPELNDEPGFSCDAIETYGDGDLGTPGEANTDCEITPPEGQCFEGGALRAVRPPAATGDVVLTEVMPNPDAVDDGDGEWFELMANADFDLNGLTVGRTDDSERDTVATPGGECHPMSAGDLAVIARLSDPAVNGGLPVVDGTFSFSLRNSNEGLWAGGSDAAGSLDAINWGSSSAGVALNLAPGAADPTSNDDEANFCDAIESYGDGDLGTPGALNTECEIIPTEGQCFEDGMPRDIRPPAAVGDLVLTEVMPNPDAVDDGDGEWFELLANADFDLNGLMVGRTDGSQIDSVATPKGECRALSAGDHVVIARRSDPSTNGGLPQVDGTFSFALRNSNEGLWAGGTSADEALDAITWNSSPAGAALSLDPASADPVANDDEGNFCDAIESYGDGDLGTPGVLNPTCDGGGMKVGDGMCLDGGVPRAIVEPSAGDLIINEWMANPAVVSDPDGEWFEVYVAANVDLNGVQLSRVDGSGMFQLEDELTSIDCLSVTAGSHLLFARDSDTMVNGGLPATDFVFGFNLINSDGGLAVGISDTHLDEVTWTSSTAGASTSLDPGSQSVAGNDDPANLCLSSTPYGPGDNTGTPGAMNPAC